MIKKYLLITLVNFIFLSWAQADRFNNPLEKQANNLALQDSSTLFSPQLLIEFFKQSTQAKITFKNISAWGTFDPALNLITINDQLKSPTQRAQVLLHELTHAYRTQFNPNEVSWLNEGLAEVQVYTASGWNDSHTGSLDKTIKMIAMNGDDPQALFSKGDQIEHFYNQSFQLVYYIYAHFGKEDVLKCMLTSPHTGWKNVYQCAPNFHFKNEEQANSFSKLSDGPGSCALPY
ncbi:MAG: hypothetical protein ACOYOK_14535 [Pseudobdellovibrionaceae bacterium]